MPLSIAARRPGFVRIVCAIGFGWAVLTVPALARAEAGPTIQHKVIASASANQPLTVRAFIVSTTSFQVAQPAVLVRWAGESRFGRFPMDTTPDAPGLYSAVLPAELVIGDFDYYLEAFDKDDNGPSQHGSSEHPHHVVVGHDAAEAAGSGKPPSPETGPAADDSPGSRPPIYPPSASGPPLPDLTPRRTDPSPGAGAVAVGEAPSARRSTLSEIGPYAVLGAGMLSTVAGAIFTVDIGHQNAVANAATTPQPGVLAANQSLQRDGVAVSVLFGLAGAAALTGLVWLAVR